MNFIIIYNANGSFLGELNYIFKHLFFNESCSACSITHCFQELGEKREFKELKKEFEITTIHRDQFHLVEVLGNCQDKQLLK